MMNSLKNSWQPENDGKGHGPPADVGMENLSSSLEEEDKVLKY